MKFLLNETRTCMRTEFTAVALKIRLNSTLSYIEMYKHIDWIDMFKTMCSIILFACLTRFF
jgi:hypothetical protein